MSVRDPSAVASDAVRLVRTAGGRLRLTEIGPTVAEVAAVALLGWMAAGLVWQGFDTAVTRAGAAGGVLSSAGVPSGAMPADNAILRNFDPFQRQGRAPQPAAVDAPETSLDLRIFGIRAGAGPESGSAVLATPDGRQHTYTTGQTVFRDVRLIAIYPDRVLLERGDGRRESLYLNPDSRRRRAEAPPEPEPETESRLSAEESGPVEFTSASAMIGALSLQPSRVDGRIRGLRIGESANATLLQRNGLKAGDVLLEIEGRALDSIGRLDSLAADLGSADSVTLTLLRDGQERRLTLDLNRKR